MNFFDVLGEMLVILFAIVAGFAARRLGWLGGETDQKLSKLLLNITMPAMILASVITGDELPEVSVILSVLEVGVAFYALALLFAYVVPRCLPGTPWTKGRVAVCPGLSQRGLHRLSRGGGAVWAPGAVLRGDFGDAL